MTESEPVEKKKRAPKMIVIGLILGVGIGAAQGNVAVGIAVGLAIGVALDSYQKDKIHRQTEEEEPLD